MRQRQRRTPAKRNDVAAFLAARGGDRVRAAKAAFYIARCGGPWDDLAFLRALQAELAHELAALGPGGGCLRQRIRELEAGGPQP